jgi:tetratricopeptide (TPR) repeat protein
VDIVPTLLELAGLETPQGLPGRSLLGAPDPDAVTYFEALTATFNYGAAPLRGVLLGSRKAIDLPLSELYDLAPDPLEQVNLAADNPEAFSGLQTRIPRDSRSWPEQDQLTARERARLEALGYLVGDAQPPENPGPEDDPKNLVHLDRKLQMVLSNYHRGNLDRAVVLAREVIAERSDMELAHRYLGFLLHQANDFRGAEKALKNALALGHDSDQVLRRLAMVLTETGRGSEAVDLLKDRARKTSSPETLNTYAIALSESGRVAQSEVIFARALELDPTYGEAYQNWGIATLKRGNRDRAEELLDKALDIDNRLPEAWNTLGVIRAQKEDLPGALEAWTQAVEIDSRQYHAMYNAGVVALQLGQTEAARQAFQRFVTTAPPGRFPQDLEKARAWLQELERAGGSPP